MPMPEPYTLIAIIGPTASGKTTFAAHLAHRLNGEIISADSRQVYMQMNLGTGKDYRDYVVHGVQIPCHLMDIVKPGYHYSIFEYHRDFLKTYWDIRNRNKLPILCGGSGMYIEAATLGYRLDEVPYNKTLRESLALKSEEDLIAQLLALKPLHNDTDTDTREHILRALEIAIFYRDNPIIVQNNPTIKTLYIGVKFDRATERSRITERLRNRMQAGLIDEVRNLLDSGVEAETLRYYGLEYRFITDYLQGLTNEHTLFSLLNTAIHQFAKRQRTWFRRMERKGCEIHWFSGDTPLDERIEAALSLYERGLPT
jgi:tRNA dimethylallyltransferase